MATSASEDGAADDSSQWTRIVRKGRKLDRKQHNPHPHPPAAGPVENFQPNASPQLSLDDVKANHEKVVSKWRGSAHCYEKLRDLVRTNAASHAAITKAVCLGLGAFDPEDGSWVAQRRSHTQLAAFLTIIEALEEHSHGDIKCYYQEPRFAQPDKEFIASLGGKVVESPDSYKLIDKTTLVFGIHLYRDIWAAALERSLPAMFVGTGWDVWEANSGAENSPDFGRIREMDATFRKLAFPQDDHSSFSSTCIYWRTSGANNEAETKQFGITASQNGDNSSDEEAETKATDACS